VARFDQRKVWTAVALDLGAFLVGVLVLVGMPWYFNCWVGLPLALVAAFALWYHGRWIGDIGPKLVLNDQGITECLTTSEGNLIRWSEIATVPVLPTVIVRRRGLFWDRWPKVLVPAIVLRLRNPTGPERQVALKVWFLDQDPRTILQMMKRWGTSKWSVRLRLESGEDHGE
jgi:hypothetical protein